MNVAGTNDNDELFTIDYIFNRQVALKQMKAGYRFGSDAVLLASYVHADKGKLLELGAGVGAVSLGTAWRCPECHITAIEKDPEIAELLSQNIAKNEMSSRISMRCHSIEHMPEQFHAMFDYVVANPPFHKETGTLSKNRHRNLAHIGDGLTLSDWLSKAIFACKPKGTICFIIRADRTDEAMSYLHQHKMGEITLFPIWPVQGNPANRMIISARKEIKSGSVFLSGITLHNVDGSLTSHASIVMNGFGIIR
ncbi:methyltransferase [Alphaproteobacteria bacterium]|nr:methyltransferase [Alphaproteobacteria bacterium]